MTRTNFPVPLVLFETYDNERKLHVRVRFVVSEAFPNGAVFTEVRAQGSGTWLLTSEGAEVRYLRAAVLTLATKGEK